MKGKFRIGLVLSSLALAAVVLLSNGSMAPTKVASAQGPEEKAEAAIFPWDSDGNKGKSNSFLGTTNGKPLVIKTNNVERMRIDKSGNVGIGTTGPQAPLHVKGANSRLRLESSAKDLWTVTEYKTDAREWHTGVGGSTSIGGLADKFYVFDLTAGVGRMVIDTTGKVGVGTYSPAAALDVANGSVRLSDPGGFGDLEFTESADMLAFRTTDSPAFDGEAFRVGTGTGVSRVFTVRNDGVAVLGGLGDPTAKQLCVNGDLMISHCSSSAEYVPTIDGGHGYPQTADLVSIAPEASNPYGDAHGPFVVQKSAQACDNNLLGYLVKRELGANGVNLNANYQPLAIYGYFPAKVTMENGSIKRGDPITSSGKAGYGMKATGACKIIGYALEDATAEGTIQVFADLGDNSAAQVQALAQENASLRAQVSAFEQGNASLQAEVRALASRLLALETNTTPNRTTAAVVR